LFQSTDIVPTVASKPAASSVPFVGSEFGAHRDAYEDEHADIDEDLEFYEREWLYFW
jgi:hypothetical protein